MGQLYDMCTRVSEEIERQGMDVFRTRGELAIECGFLPTLVKPADADDPEKIRSLRAAAEKVLGLSL